MYNIWWSPLRKKWMEGVTENGTNYSECRDSSKRLFKFCEVRWLWKIRRGISWPTWSRSGLSPPLTMLSVTRKPSSYHSIGKGSHSWNTHPTDKGHRNCWNMHSMVAIHCSICRWSAKNHGLDIVSERTSGQLPMTAPTAWHCPWTSGILSPLPPDGIGSMLLFRTISSTLLHNPHKFSDRNNLARTPSAELAMA